MAEIIVAKDSKLIKVLAAQARNERIDSNITDEANNIIHDLASDMNPHNRHQIAQTMAYALTDLQKPAMNFLDYVADQKNVAYGEKAEFEVRTGTIHAYMQAKGATTPRSYVASRRMTVDTNEISIRPAINIVDLRYGRVNMADLLREGNQEMTNKKLKAIVNVIDTAIANLGSPYYVSGLTQANLDTVVNHFRRLGPVTILGDQAMTGAIAGYTGMAMSNSITQHSEAQMNEYNETGFIGRYKGQNVITFENAYDEDGVTPILPVDMLYIIPGAMNGDARNLKVVNEGDVQAFESQNIDD